MHYGSDSHQVSIEYVGYVAMGLCNRISLGNLKSRKESGNIFIYTASFTTCLLILIAIVSNYWLYEMETWSFIDATKSNETINKLFLSNSGLWKICCSEDACERQCKPLKVGNKKSPTVSSSAYIIGSLRKHSVFPICSALLGICGGFMILLGKTFLHRFKLGMMLVSGILFVLSGLMNVLGIIIYISTNPKLVKSSNSPYPQYGWSFSVAACAFLLAEIVGVFIVKVVVAEKYEKSNFEDRLTSYKRRSVAGTLDGKDSTVTFNRRKSIVLPPSIQLRQNFQRKMDIQAMYDSENDSDDMSQIDGRLDVERKIVNFRSLDVEGSSSKHSIKSEDSNHNCDTPRNQRDEKPNVYIAKKEFNLSNEISPMFKENTKERPNPKISSRYAIPPPAGFDSLLVDTQDGDLGFSTTSHQRAKHFDVAPGRLNRSQKNSLDGLKNVSRDEEDCGRVHENHPQRARALLLCKHFEQSRDSGTGQSYYIHSPSSENENILSQLSEKELQLKLESLNNKCREASHSNVGDSYSIHDYTNSSNLTPQPKQRREYVRQGVLSGRQYFANGSSAYNEDKSNADSATTSV